MKYFYTAGYYFDCPTCDSTASDPEDIFVSPVFDNVDDLVKHIASMVPDYYFYSIYATGEYGTIETIVPTVNNTNARHRVVNVKFTIGDTAYTINNIGLITTEKIEVKDEQTT